MAHPPFATFYEQEHGQQVRRAFLLTGSDEVANDVVHDAFVALLPRYEQLEHPGSYLSQTVLNRCRDLSRREGSRRRAFERLAADGTDADTGVDHLYDIVAALPFNQRAAVVLRFYAGLSHAETAAAMGCPIGSVGPWISKALDNLRKELR